MDMITYPCHNPSRGATRYYNTVNPSKIWLQLKSMEIQLIQNKDWSHQSFWNLGDQVVFVGMGVEGRGLPQENSGWDLLLIRGGGY